MPEEKQPDVASYENIPTTALGILAYMASRFKRDANQLASGVRGIFNPVFTHDTDDEALLEDNELSKESETCKESSLLTAPLNDLFDAESAEELEKAKVNVKKFNELLKEEPPPETVNVPSTQKICDANIPPQLGDLSERIKILLGSLNNKIWSLAQERGISAAQKAGSLAEIRTRILNLQSNLEHKHPRKDALIRAIAAIQQSIINNQDKLSSYRSKWGSGFFFGTILRRDLTKRVTSKILIDDLSDELDDIKRSIDSPKVRWRVK